MVNNNSNITIMYIIKPKILNILPRIKFLLPMYNIKSTIVNSSGYVPEPPKLQATPQVLPFLLPPPISSPEVPKKGAGRRKSNTLDSEEEKFKTRSKEEVMPIPVPTERWVYPEHPDKLGKVTAEFPKRIVQLNRREIRCRFRGRGEIKRLTTQVLVVDSLSNVFILTDNYAPVNTAGYSYINPRVVRLTEQMASKLKFIIRLIDERNFKVFDEFESDYIDFVLNTNDFESPIIESVVPLSLFGLFRLFRLKLDRVKIGTVNFLTIFVLYLDPTDNVFKAVYFVPQRCISKVSTLEALDTITLYLPNIFDENFFLVADYCCFPNTEGQKEKNNIVLDPWPGCNQDELVNLRIINRPWTRPFDDMKRIIIA
ncbi:hypothetical protein SAMD00019534_013220 [Acytostelium subglobosum LB1]|uniref:hypothetical protein n=1 Tax=Acytostelium subglobosum LB1 TaxID=1410327 RepID=UPI00064513C4|nr:hypothetical protein SAMD00019534_013220 [Acytostelium subglobosum LB1]GAM18147.1 hypothetical protein SAMD00019534_013220 [Acytostelium subglobosum LB1]|eukprot:XP_012758743.1 hypothetical protein SAMD00019534_013220 [Acytostelium subglobosum LB1]